MSVRLATPALSAAMASDGIASAFAIASAERFGARVLSLHLVGHMLLPTALARFLSVRAWSSVRALAAGCRGQGLVSPGEGALVREHRVRPAPVPCWRAMNGW